MRRTLELLYHYRGPYDATILINYLLGLLVIPSERSLDRVPDDPITDLKARWGISPGSIKQFGRERPETVRQLVRSLRNAVAHFQIKPTYDRERCIGFAFRDRNGFHAVIVLDEMQAFVEKLANYLEHTMSA
jgi:hypothetical protein